MNAKMIRRLLIAWGMLAVPLALLGASSPPQVKTASGIVEGKADGAVHAFLGIPYAAPQWASCAGSRPCQRRSGLEFAKPPSSVRTACREEFTAT